MIKMRTRYEYPIRWQGLLPVMGSVKSDGK